MTRPRFKLGSDGHPVLQIESWEDVDAAIVMQLKAGAVGTAHLYRALRDGRIALLPITPDTSASKFKAFARATGNRPAICLIGDDDGCRRGPAGWPLAVPAIQW